MSRGKCRLKFKQLFPSMLLSDWGEREREREKEITIKIFMKWVEGNIALNLNNYSLQCFSAIGERERERERERKKLQLKSSWNESREMSP